ncbi:cytochrome P450 [Actinomadura fibrosa]|uniref:Cytochrome P450 n=1 Tax=Actinomadura fibrosa TaxID=111802 RepID=A0ABW2XYA9_9ACTN|nr:cytochrome P450 [Actinomadura fibrosa]
MSIESVETGSIYYDPYDYEIDRDPHPVWRRMREEAPVYWNERYEFFALSRFQDVWDAYHDTATFSSSHGVELERLDRPVEQPMMIFMDPPEHDRLRALVSKAFTPGRVRRLEESITALVDEYLDPFRGTSGFDFVRDFGALLPPVVIGELLGVPAADRDLFRTWNDQLLHREEGQTEPGEEAAEAGRAMFLYTLEMIAERRRRPREDLITALTRAEVQDAGGVRTLTEDEVVFFVLLLAGAGVETVARLLSWTAVVLARNPDQRALLAADPSLVPGAIEELLRFEAPSPVNGRWTTRPVEVQGVTIPAESKVLLLNGSANRDPREFADPDRFDVRRSIGRHITFGFGAHFCLGAALARMEGRLALAGTLRRFPVWEIDESELVPVHTSTVRGFSSVPVHLA